MVMRPDDSYPKSSGTDQTASGPDLNHPAPDSRMASPGVGNAPDNGVAPPASPRATDNRSQVVPHQTSCRGDSVLESAIANGMAMHDEGSAGGMKSAE